MLLGLTLVFAVALAAACDPSIDGCAECDSTGKTCTKCNPSSGTPYLKGNACVNADGCTGEGGYYTDDTTNPQAKTCLQCIGSAAKCTKCNPSSNVPYLKKAGDAATGICVNADGCKGSGDYYPDDTNTKTCKSCAEGVSNCKTCTKESSGNTVTCSACLEGFFIETVAGSGTPSKKCTACADSNCAVCDGGADQCSKCKDGFNLESGKCASSSTNKSSLSTGAIAGISVAAVVVVGGLVGFLCWWFICRGKA